MNIVLNTEKGVEITSVNEYIEQINSLNNNKNNPGSLLFFRGQAVDYWDIRPSIYRDNMLSVEHHLMSEPLRQVPNEFQNLGGSFEIMEKYQHYGMCTRLLDITTNPLVALYFACEHYGKEEYKDISAKEIIKKSPQGIVYFKEESMPSKYNDLSIQIISRMASYDLNNSNTLEDVILKLFEDKIISSDQMKKWLDEDEIQEFIHICQNVYTVLPIMNNDRLIRQSGAFLLLGKFNVEDRNGELKNAIITKAEANLREEFDEKFFYIDDDNKELIRTELEHFNISEANLFPELEYQLKHIRKLDEQSKREVSYFVKFNRMEVDRTKDVVLNDEIDMGTVKEIVGGFCLDKDLTNAVEKIFINNFEVDWFKRDSVISRVRILIRKELNKYGYTKEKSEELTNKIIDKIKEKQVVR